MYRSTLIFTVVALAATASGLSFSISNLAAEERLTPPGFFANFTVAAPGSVFEQGGPDPAACNISQPGRAVNSCWSSCTGGSGQYYTRVTPGSYNGAADFSLDVWQAYVYELGNHNNATTPISKNTTACYECVNGSTQGGEQWILCQTEGGSTFNQTYTAYYGGADPPADELCTAQ